MQAILKTEFSKSYLSLYMSNNKKKTKKTQKTGKSNKN